MKKIIRRAASAVLVLCFVLPLSMCSLKEIDADGNAIVADTFTDGYELTKQAWNEIEVGNVVDGAGLLFAIFNVFFLPFACLKLQEKTQAILHFVSSLPAGFFLYFWVWVFCTRPQYGGFLAASCWSILFLLSAATIGRRIYSRLFGTDMQSHSPT